MAVKELSPNEATLLRISHDFRTDTITVPTDEMFDLMKHATRGDDVYAISLYAAADTRLGISLAILQEDEDTIALQNKIAQLAGKEAGLFCVSGTMSNQLALRTHLTQPPHSIMLDSRAHVHCYEAGGVAFHSQANTISQFPENGHHLTLEEVEENIIQGDDIHGAPTKVVSLENTLSGMVFPQDEIIKISDSMRAKGVIMHCDGARMWEAQVKTGKSLKELCAPFDTVSLCMSKGLGAPIGSVLVGPKAFIQKAIWFKKLFGGGIRQAGSLALAANYCLDNHLPLLSRTHTLASHLAVSLADVGVRILLPTETNMVWIDTVPLGFEISTLIAKAKESGVRLGGSRLVIHHQTSPDAVEKLVEAVKALKEEYKHQALVVSEEEEKMWKGFARGEWEKVPKPRTKRLGVLVY
ncbi:threonine aldolase [Pseudohyphozyma bogoriensis]|nr:threonine aldolase [Pseudohyphozyma bogoriensis]